MKPHIHNQQISAINESKCCNCGRNHQPKSCPAYEDKCGIFMDTGLNIAENKKLSTASQTNCFRASMLWFYRLGFNSLLRYHEVNRVLHYLVMFRG